MNENKYRIRVEVIGEEEPENKISENLRHGIECDGFVILGNSEVNGKPDVVVMHRITMNEITNLIMKRGELVAAGMLAKTKIDAKKYMTAGAKENLLEEIFRRMRDE
jgi:hypothetical protein